MFDADLNIKFEAAVAQLRLQRDAASKAHLISLNEAFGNLDNEMKELKEWMFTKEE